ncbi:MAG TPA: glycosyltransferase family 4 protein [Terrimicrobiaceae bacterium]
MRKAETRIAVFYPWTGLPALDRGSSRRVVPLIRLLAEQYDQVRVVSPGARPDQWRSGNLEYRLQRPSAIERAMLGAAFAVFDSAFHRLFRGRVPPRERRQWWHYLSVDLQWNLAREVRRTVSWSSVVLLEYPFWEKAVLASCAEARRESLLTMHDTLSDIVVSSTWLREKVRNRELSAARKASSVFCVSESDRQHFAKEGIVAQFVPHGISIEPCTRDSTPESPELRRVERARGLGKTVCLFVGSSLSTNQEAVEEIRRIAAALASQGDFRFAIAGACLSRGTYEHHVIAFGPVEDALLDKLYQVADIVLAPLRSGTGTSLKVLEAFVHQKALVATRMGVRGYPVRDGTECMICDEPQSYPEVLSSLRANPGRLRALGEAGSAFVKAYDYRVVYQPYLECIDRFLAARPA